MVEGRVNPGITVSPASLFMGVVEPGQKVTKSMVVRGSKPFKILSIVCDDKSFQFGQEQDRTAKMVHVVPVTFVAGPDVRKVTKTIRIETRLGPLHARAVGLCGSRPAVDRPQRPASGRSKQPLTLPPYVLAFSSL